MISEELALRLGLKTEGFDSGLERSTSKAEGFGEKLGAKLGDKLFGLRDVSHAVATALGLNLENIAENIARKITGISKAEEDAYKRSEEIGTQAADAAIKNMRDRLTEEQKYQLNLNERDKLVQRISENEVKSGKDLLQLNEDKLELEKKTTDIQDYQAKQRALQQKAVEEEIKGRNDLAAEEQKAALAQLTAGERRKALTDDVTGLEKSIVLLKQSGINASYLENELKDKQKQLIEATADVEKKRIEDRRKIVGSNQDELEFLKLTDKAIRGIATGADSERLAVMKLQQQERSLLIQMDELEEKAITGKITPAEQRRLLEMDKQKTNLDDQIAAKQQLIGETDDEATAEAKVTAELERQAKVRPPSKPTTPAPGQFGGTGSALGLHNLGDLSTDALQEALKQINSQISQGQMDWQQKGYGSSVSGSTFANTNYWLFSELDSLKQELARRDALTAANAKGGRAATLQEYVRTGGDPLAFDQVYSQVNNWASGQAETNQQLGKIAGALSNIQGHVGTLITG